MRGLVVTDRHWLALTLCCIVAASGAGLYYGVGTLSDEVDVANDMPLGVSAPILDQYVVQFAGTSTKGYITEFKDSKGRHCMMGIYDNTPVLSCEGQ